MVQKYSQNGLFVCSWAVDGSSLYENPYTLGLFMLLFYGGSETIYCFLLVKQAKLEWRPSLKP